MNELRHPPSLRTVMVRLMEVLFIVAVVGAPATVYLRGVLRDAASQFGKSPDRLLLEVSGFALVLTGAVVLSVWLALSPTSLMKRLLVGTAGIAVAGGAMGAISEGPNLITFLFVAIVVVNVVFVALLLRWRGFIMVRWAKRDQARPGITQFSILQMMLLTTLVALLLLGIRMLAINDPGVWSFGGLLLGFFVIAVILSGPAVLAAWTTLRTKVSRWGLWTFVALTASLVALVRVVLHWVSPLPGDAWSCLVLVHYITVMPAFFMLRVSGYRLVPHGRSQES